MIAIDAGQRNHPWQAVEKVTVRFQE